MVAKARERPILRTVVCKRNRCAHVERLESFRSGMSAWREELQVLNANWRFAELVERFPRGRNKRESLP